MRLRPAIKASLMLFLITALWGATLPVMHYFRVYTDSTLFVAARFIVATLAMLPLVRQHLKFTNKKILCYGIILGTINSLIYIFQTIALKSVASASVAFLLSAYVLVVPLLYPLFKLRNPRLGEIIAGIICFYGIYILYGAKFDYNVGYIWAMLSMLGVAISLIIIELVAKQVQSLIALNFYQIVFAIPLPFLYAVTHITTISNDMTFGFWISVFYCAIPATAIAFNWQLKYQGQVGAAKTALIFSLEAIFASIIAWLLGEPIGHNILIGGGVILISIFMVDLIHIIRAHLSSQKTL